MIGDMHKCFMSPFTEHSCLGWYRGWLGLSHLEPISGVGGGRCHGGSLSCRVHHVQQQLAHCWSVISHWPYTCSAFCCTSWTCFDVCLMQPQLAVPAYNACMLDRLPHFVRSHVVARVFLATASAVFDLRTPDLVVHCKGCTPCH